MLVFGVLRVLFGSSTKAAVPTVVVILIIFSYGHLYELLKQGVNLDSRIVRHRYLLPLIALGLGLVFLRIIRAKPSRDWFPTLNVAALVLVILPTYQIVRFGLDAEAAKRATQLPTDCRLSLRDDSIAPDIYVIVLDAYERDDILREMHGFDNSPFLSNLESLGFYIARGSLSNYRHTGMSLGSMLNMKYRQSEGEAPPENSRDIPSISQNEVRQQLECLGYQTVAFETGAYFSEWQDADFYITSESSILELTYATGGVSRFEVMLIESSIGRAIFDLATQMGLAPEIVADSALDEHRQRILFVFQQLERVRDLRSPKLVFVHIISPHPPFVFGPAGQRVSSGRFETDPDLNEKDQLAAYVDQVTYLNTRVLEVVEQFLADSATPPIIIIQGDHGWADRTPEDKLAILNAYHLPGGGNNFLYSTITPVNTFRTILDFYFDANLGFLQDLSYFSTVDKPYRFELVENRWSSE